VRHILSQEEDHAWVLEGDVLPVVPLDAERTLDQQSLARRGPGIHHWTWFCFDAKFAAHPYQRTDAREWLARGCTREDWPEEIPCPPEYVDDDHFEWCEPGFLHLDRIRRGLASKKLQMLEHILGHPIGPPACKPIPDPPRTPFRSSKEFFV